MLKSVEKMPASNKSFAIMAADVKTQTLVLRKIISDYPQCPEVETATIAIAKTLQCGGSTAGNYVKY